MTQAPRSAEASAQRLAEILARCAPQILDEWKQATRRLPAARELSSRQLVDHMPAVLAAIADAAVKLLAGEPHDIPLIAAHQHALDRLGEGFDVVSVLTELSILRECILGVWWREDVEHDGAVVRAIDVAVDRAIADSVARYAQARDRALAAIDAISNATLESASLDDFLKRLLGEFTRLAPTADTATILLVENDRLHVRAIAGTDRPVEEGFSLAFGEGFSGTIAATRQPLALQDAESDPIIKSTVFRGQGVRALYGVPLLANERVIGVVHMGSRRVSELSADDRHLFTSMAARAAAGIHHHMLRQQLQQSEEQARNLAAERASVLGKLESLLSAAPVGIGFVDRDLRYLRVNDTLAMLDGRSIAEHLGRRVDEVLPRTGPALSRVLQRILETGEAVLDWEFTASPPSTPAESRTFVAYYFPVRAGGEVTGVGAVVLEVTERKAIENQLRETLRDRDDMLAIVSHDLRNPLGAIKLSATLLETRDGDSRVRKHVEMIERTVERMERLIEDLLDTAAIRAGKLAVELRPEPAAAVVSEALDLQAPLAAEKQIAFDRRCEVGDVAILCDRNRILQLFGNILANALRFSRAGDTITVTATREGDHVRFAIADRGPGITPELAAEIFEPYRAAPQQQRRTSGLGLFIAKGIIDAHGGRIWVESEPGNGATFVFTIPIAH